MVLKIRELKRQSAVHCRTLVVSAHVGFLLHSEGTSTPEFGQNQD